MPRKTRIEIPPARAARALFLSDRTCCVCREGGKPVQIHHIDEDPSNNHLANLAILCLDCHNDTQIRGGFARKLDADQVILYRDDWHRAVARSRATIESTSTSGDTRRQLALALSIAEIYRENQEFELLAIHYDQIGNIELRDKYIEMAIEKSPSDSTISFLRGLQRKPETIPVDVIERQLEQYAKYDDKLQRARFLLELGRYRDAALDYVEGIAESLREPRLFGAAFYLKELAESQIITELFVEALGEAAARNDLWWQVRALQELGWHKELADLLLRHETDITSGSNLMLRILLADAKGDEALADDLRKQLARGAHVVIVTDDKEDEPEPGARSA